MPLDRSDLVLLKRVAGHWSMRHQPSNRPDVRRERRLEIYKLLRTLLATSFRGLQSGHRSKQLDQISSLLKAFAFVDESDALAFAMVHHPDPKHEPSSTSMFLDEQDDEELSLELEGEAVRKVIPIVAANAIIV